MYEFCEDYEKMFENIAASAYTHVAAQKVKSLIIGVSGGIDSALTAALAQEVVKRLDNDVLLEGRIIDIKSNETEMSRAVRVAESFCHGYQYRDLTDIYLSVASRIIGTVDDNTKSRIRLGNIKARLRMIQLYDLANSLNGMVLSTDNYTEYLLGFWTLHGDVGDFGMIQNLWKTEVYGLAEYLVKKFNLSGRSQQADALKECIDAVPTDGLGVTNSDFDQICPDHDKNLSSNELYQKVDKDLFDYIYDRVLKYGHLPMDQRSYFNNSIIERYEATEFKRNNPFNIPREYVIK